MKKIHKIFVTGIGFISLWRSSTAYAAIDALLPKVAPKYAAGSKINLVNQLPDAGWAQLIGNAIKLLLSIAGPLAFISCVVGGVIMITAHGEDEKIRKGKHILLWSVLALIIIAASYAIVTGVTQLQFIQPK